MGNALLYQPPTQHWSDSFTGHGQPDVTALHVGISMHCQSHPRPGKHNYHMNEVDSLLSIKA